MKRIFFVFIFLFGCGTAVYAAGANPQALKAMKQKRMAQQRGGPGASQQTQGPKLSTEQINQLITSLKTSSVVWPKIPGDNNKALSVSYFISEFKKKGVTIKKPTARYTSIITGMTSQNPGLLKMPLDRLLQTTAIVEYDFDNGQDKDLMAKKLLGEAGYLRNKKRLSAPPQPGRTPLPQGSRSPRPMGTPYPSASASGHYTSSPPPRPSATSSAQSK